MSSSSVVMIIHYANKLGQRAVMTLVSVTKEQLIFSKEVMIRCLQTTASLL